MTDAGVAYVQLLPSMRGFSAAASRGLKGSLDQPATGAGKTAGRGFITGFADTLTRGGKSISGLGDKLTVGLTAPLILAGNKVTNLARDTNENLSKVQTVFGDSARTIEQFASTAAQSFGLSNRSALEATGNFGNMFTQLQFGQRDAAGMSTEMVGLAADFSSFHNADITQVLDAQAAAFRGEFDALQRFVPTINAANVQQRALTDTGKESVDQLTEQEKATATYALMLEGAGSATGDFARTQNELANQERITAAEAENAAAVFGQNLIPIKMKLVEIVGRALDAFNNLSPEMQENIVKGGLLVAALGPVLSIFGRIVSGVGGIIKGFVGLGKGIGFVAKGGFKLVQFGARGAMAMTRLAMAAGRAGLAIVKAGAQMIASVVKATARVVASIVTQIAKWVLLGVQALLHAAKIALAWLISLGPIAILIAAVIAAVALIIANWDKVSAFIVAAATWVWNKIIEIWNAIVAFISGALDAIVDFIASIPERVVAFIQWYFDKYFEIWGMILGFLADTFTSIVDFFAGLPDRVVEFITWIFDKFSETFDNVVDWVSGAIAGVVDMFAGLPSSISSAISSIVSTITGPFKRAFNAIADKWNSTVGGFGFTIPSWVPVLGNKSFKIPSMHSGGIFQAAFGNEGLALLRSGEMVLTEADQRALLSGGASGAAARTEVIFSPRSNDLLMRWFKQNVRVKGGTVQTAFT